MENEILKINIISIATSGLLILIFGIALYYFRSSLNNETLRFFLPIPPIGVAAYVYVFNMLKCYDCNLPEKSTTLFYELFIATVISGTVFLIFVGSMVIILKLFMK
ncbi:MAG: hypothetical protein KOO64_09255 [Desulfobacterales bacterium]|nr:hypothetical protein [Desulfobacterales bacterium]